MTIDQRHDYRNPTASKWRAPRAVADGGGGIIIAIAQVEATPERVFTAFTTDDVERWWGHPEYYRQENWKADVRVCGSWSVATRMVDGSVNHGFGEFVEVQAPNKLVMTREFEKHPLMGSRETTITYRFDPVDGGTRITVRDEGFIGRSEAAYGNAEHWERVLGWLIDYLRAERKNGGHTVASATFGTHASMRVARKDQDALRSFYRDVLGAVFTEQGDDKDVLRLGDNFYLAFLYGDFPDESEFLRTAKAMWLELKSDNVEELRCKIVNSGVRKLDVPDPHLYFQAPGGQCWRLVGLSEDLSQYEGNVRLPASSAEFLKSLDTR